jgi:hypothetical protein
VLRLVIDTFARMTGITRILPGIALGISAFASAAGCLKVDVVDPGDIPVLPAGGTHVLFIGNSLTYTNSLPQTVIDLGRASGDTIHALQVALPNFAVIDHALGMSNALGVIQSQPWNYVVIQQGPTTTQVNRDTLIMAAKILDPHVKAAGGRIAAFMAWPSIDQPHLFDAVRRSAELAAEAVQGVFIPAGQAWHESISADPSIQLYSADGYHPGPLGTYLAALVTYEKITGKDARLLPGEAVVGGVRLGANEQIVRHLQQVAHETARRY